MVDRVVLATDARRPTAPAPLVAVVLALPTALQARWVHAPWVHALLPLRRRRPPLVVPPTPMAILAVAVPAQLALEARPHVPTTQRHLSAADRMVVAVASVAARLVAVVVASAVAAPQAAVAAEAAALADADNGGLWPKW